MPFSKLKQNKSEVSLETSDLFHYAATVFFY